MAGSIEVDHRPVRVEEAGGLLDRGDEQLVHLAAPPSGSLAGCVASAGAST